VWDDSSTFPFHSHIKKFADFSTIKTDNVD
jgi:hypothetical protein